MKKMLLIVVLLFCLSIAFGQSEDFLQPYSVDDNTVLLLHFDGDATNESELSGDAVGYGNFQFIDHDEMTNMGKYVWLDNDARSDSTYFLVPDTSALDLDSSWTVECWAKPLTFGTEASDWHIYPKLVSKPSNWWMGINGAPGTKNVQSGYETVQPGLWRDVATSVEVIELGKWYHIAAILDVDTKVYSVVVHDKDGNLVAYNSSYIPEEVILPTTNDEPVQIGVALWWGDTWFNGLIDEVRISNCVRKFDMPPEIVAEVIKKVEDNVAIPVDIKVAASGWDVSEVKLHYAIGNDDVFSELVMTTSDEVTYSATIPAQESGTSIKYYITVENTAGDIGNSMLSAEKSDTAYFGIAVGNLHSLVLDLDFEQSLYDSTGINTVVPTGAVTYSDDAISGDYSIHFTPQETETDTVVTMLKVEKPAPFLAFKEGYTIDMWINPDTIITWSALTGKYPEYYNDDNDWKFNYRLYWDGRHLNKLNIENYYSNTVWQRVYLDNTLLETNKWYRVTAQFSVEKNILMIELYDKDGNLIESNWQEGGDFPLMARAGAFTLGGDIYDYMSDVRFQGKMDAIKIYNYAAFLPPTLESSLPQQIVHILPNTEKAINVSVDNSVSTKLHYSVNGGEEVVVQMDLSGDMDYSATIPGQELGAIVEYYIIAVNDMGKELRLPGDGTYIVAYNNENDMVLHLDFEEGSGVPVDASDYNNEVAVYNIIEYSDDAFSGSHSLYYENDSSYIRVDPPAPFVINDEMTIEVSFNADEIPADGTDLIAKYPDPGDWAFGFRISFQADGKLFPEFYLVADNPGEADRTWDALFLKNDTRIAAGNWYTFVMEVGNDSAYVRLYNGEGNLLDDNSKDVSGQHLNPVDGMLALGRSWWDPAPVFQGKFDDIKLYNYSKTEIEVAINSEKDNLIPEKYELAQNYPNPFNPTTQIEFMMPEAQTVKLVIYNLIGQEVKTLVNSKLNAGKHIYQWNGTNRAGEVLSSGIYFYRLETPEFTKTRKMIYIR